MLKEKSSSSLKQLKVKTCLSSGNSLVPMHLVS